MSKHGKIPIILCISGHDPSGGAGIQADAEAVAGSGGHACCVVAAITEQDSCDVHRTVPQPPEQILRQSRRILEDSQVAAIKIGLMGSAETVSALAELLDQVPDIPVVLDPVLASGGGTDLTDGILLSALRRELLRKATLITPNSVEARRLASADLGVPECADRLLDLGCQQVLITGAHEEGPEVTNRLYGRSGLLDASRWPRLPFSYHGSGCTLAASIAAHLALGEELTAAVRGAQAFTWECLRYAVQTGRCQPIPDRLFRLGRGSRA